MSIALLGLIGGGEARIRLASSACDAIATFRFKKGSTFEITGRYGVRGRYVALTGMTMSASVSFFCGSDPIALTVTPDPDQVSNPGKFTISGDTAGWPTGCGEADIRFVSGDDVFYSETFHFHIDTPITVPDP